MKGDTMPFHQRDVAQCGRKWSAIVHVFNAESKVWDSSWSPYYWLSIACLDMSRRHHHFRKIARISTLLAWKRGPQNKAKSSPKKWLRTAAFILLKMPTLHFFPEPSRTFENLLDHSRMPTHLLESSGRNPADASSSHAPSDHVFIHVYAPRSGSLPFKVIKKM